VSEWVCFVLFSLYLIFFNIFYLSLLVLSHSRILSYLTSQLSRHLSPSLNSLSPLSHSLKSLPLNSLNSHTLSQISLSNSLSHSLNSLSLNSLSLNSQLHEDFGTFVQRVKTEASIWVHTRFEPREQGRLRRGERRHQDKLGRVPIHALLILSSYFISSHLISISHFISFHLISISNLISSHLISSLISFILISSQFLISISHLYPHSSTRIGSASS